MGEIWPKIGKFWWKMVKNLQFLPWKTIDISTIFQTLVNFLSYSLCPQIESANCPSHSRKFWLFGQKSPEILLQKNWPKMTKNGQFTKEKGHMKKLWRVIKKRIVFLKMALKTLSNDIFMRSLAAVEVTFPKGSNFPFFDKIRWFWRFLGEILAINPKIAKNWPFLAEIGVFDLKNAKKRTKNALKCVYEQNMVILRFLPPNTDQIGRFLGGPKNRPKNDQFFQFFDQNRVVWAKMTENAEKCINTR